LALGNSGIRFLDLIDSVLTVGFLKVQVASIVLTLDTAERLVELVQIYEANNLGLESLLFIH
jgi:hypothetical protein